MADSFVVDRSLIVLLNRARQVSITYWIRATGHWVP